MRDLQFLLLYSLMGTKAPVEPSRWCKFQAFNKLTNVVLLVLDGIGLEEYQSWLREDEKLAKLVGSVFDHKLQFVSPYSYGSTVADDLCILPLSSREIANAKKLYGSIEKAVMANGDYTKVMRSSFPIGPSSKDEMSSSEDDNVKTKLLLTLDQLHRYAYPVPTSRTSPKASAGFVFSNDNYKPVSKDSPIYAVDCEMVITSSGDHELAAVCLMDSEFKVLYKSFVRPDNAVTNYLTKFSGITAHMLAGIETRLRDVQEQIRNVLPADAILAGHSLENDLRALKMFHPYVIDTSLCYNLDHSGSRKPKLRDLAKLFLDKDIQSWAERGHDPEEDARSTMELVHLKLTKGYKFGDSYLGANIGEEAVAEMTNLATSSLKTLQKSGKAVQVVACPKELEGYEKATSGGTDHNLTKASSSGEAVKTAAENCHCHQLTICHLDGKTISGKSARKKIKQLWKSLPANGLLLTVWSGTEKDANPAVVGIGINKGIPGDP